MATTDKNSRLITKEKVLSGEPYVIPQPETLYTVRPRYFRDKSVRGSRATFRILTRGITSSSARTAQEALAERVRKKLISKDGMADFILQSMQLGFNEKAQVIQTFGDAETVYYFGRSPTTISLSGTLIDDIDNDWFVRFISGYNEFLRGTQLAQRFELVKLSTHNATFTGTIMNLSYAQNSNNDAAIQFNCTFLIKTFEYHSSYQYGKELADDVEYQALQSVENQPTLTQSDITKLLNNARGTDVDARDVRNKEEALSALGGTLSPSGTYATEIATAFNETLGGITDTITKLSDNINKFANAVEDATSSVLNPINDIIGAVSDFTDAGFSVVRAIDNTIDSVLDPISVVVNNFNNVQRQLKNLRGTITSLPETLSEKVSRFARAGYIANPAFLMSPSANINTSEALKTIKSTNVRTPRTAGSLGPVSDSSNTADQVARL